MEKTFKVFLLICHCVASKSVLSLQTKNNKFCGKKKHLFLLNYRLLINIYCEGQVFCMNIFWNIKIINLYIETNDYETWNLYIDFFMALLGLPESSAPLASSIFLLLVVTVPYNLSSK